MNRFKTFAGYLAFSTLIFWFALFGVDVFTGNDFVWHHFNDMMWTCEGAFMIVVLLMLDTPMASGERK